MTRNEDETVEMDEQQMQDCLVELFDQLALMRRGDEYPDDLPEEFAAVRSARTFEDVGVLTNNAGLVIRMAEGSEFQLTIVQSREAR
jgi:hypothetical protein